MKHKVNQRKILKFGIMTAAIIAIVAGIVSLATTSVFATPGQTRYCEYCHVSSSTTPPLTVSTDVNGKTVAPGAVFVANINWTGGSGTTEVNWPTIFSAAAPRSNTLFAPNPRIPYSGPNASGSTSSTLTAPSSPGTYTLRVYAGITGAEYAFQDIIVTVSAPSDTAGPLTSSVNGTPNPTAGAASVTLTASVSDTTTGNSNVAAAEYFIDTAGTNGTGVAMSASDGAFSSPTEAVTATVNVSGLTIGSHTLYVHGRDAANNWGATASVNITVSAPPDTTGPLTSIVTATPNPTAGAASVALSASMSDVTTGNSNIAAAEYFIDAAGSNGTGTAMSASDSAFNSPTELVTVNVSVSGLAIGNHTLYLHGKDAANNWGPNVSKVITVSVAPDTTGPLTSSVASTPNPTAGATSVTLTASVIDATTGNSNIAAAEYFVDTAGGNGTGTAMTASDGAFSSPTEAVTASVNVSGLSIGSHTLYVHGRDAAGNWGATASVNITVSAAPDTAGPVTSSVAAVPNPTAGVTSVTLAASVSDTTTGGSNIAAAEYFVDTIGLNGAGTALSATDGSFSSPTEAVTATVNVSGLTIGNHTFYVHGRDAANNWGATASVNITVSVAPDSTGPLTSGVNATPNPTAGAASVTLTASVSDATTGNSNITAAEYFVDIVGLNGAGMVMSATDGSFNSPTEAVTATVNVSGLSVGNHTLYVHGRDAANNWGATASVIVSITAPPADTTGPVTTGVNVSPNPTAGAASVTLTAVTSDATTGGSNIVAVEYFIDSLGVNGNGTAMNAADGSFNSVTESVTAIVNVSGLSIGDHIIYVSGEDAANNWEATASTVITVSAPATDNAGPLTTNVTAKPKTASVTTAVTLTALISDTATGGSNITNAEYFIDMVGINGNGMAMSAADRSFNAATETVTGSANVASLSAGRHTIYVHGRDAAGNWGPVVSLNFRVKRAARPSLSQLEIEDDHEEVLQESDLIDGHPQLSVSQNEIEEDHEEILRESDLVSRSTELSGNQNGIEQSRKETLRGSDPVSRPPQLSGSQNRIEQTGKEILRASDRKDEGQKKEGEGAKRIDRSK